MALVGCVLAILGDAITLWLRADLSFFEHSISRVAAGPHAAIADTGLSVFAVGMLAVAWALYDWNLGGRRYRWGTALLALSGILIFLLAVWNDYDRKDADDFGFHMNLLYLLAVSFPIAAWLVAPGLEKVNRAWRRFSQSIAVLWIASGPIYFLTPDAFAGLFERAVMMLPLIWLASVAILLINRSYSGVR